MTDLSLPLATPTSSLISRSLLMAYSLAAYGIGMGGLMFLILACLGVLPFGSGTLALEGALPRLGVNLGLVGAFGVQHAIMARPAFKRRWREVLPRAAERSTFVLLSGALLGLTTWLWQPFAGSVWSVEAPAARAALLALAGLGWGYLVLASFAIDHFELFGLRQGWQAFRGRPIDSPPFRRRLMYRFDRHPIMTGVLVGLWATPDMGRTRLVLALAFTAYIVIGVAMEERDLVAAHGEKYEQYRREVGSAVPSLREG